MPRRPDDDHDTRPRTDAPHPNRAWRRLRAALTPLALLALVATGAVAAAHGDGRWQLVDVAPLGVACAGAPGATCPLVRPLGTDAWQPREAAIHGFERVDAHGYRLLVRGDQATDAWTLVAVLEDQPLGDVDWRIVAVEIDGERVHVDAERDPRLRFDLLDGRVYGSAGCNRLSAPIAPGVGPRLGVGPVVGTLMACPEPVMRREQALVQALEGNVTYERDGDALRVHGVGGAVWLEPILPEGPTAAGRVWPDAELVDDAERIARAADADEPWAFDPLRVALVLHPVMPESASVDVQRRDTSVEFAPYSVVRITETGLLDDSVAALSDVLVLERLDDGTWRVIAATQAQRCARGERAGWIGLPDLCP